MIERKELGRFFKSIRVAKFDSQNELAEVCGCSQSQVSALERGVTKHLDIFWLVDLCHSLDVDFEDVVKTINSEVKK